MRDYIVDNSIIPEKLANTTVKTTASNHILYRHNSNKGTVISFKDTKQRYVLVLDAQYRSNVSGAEISVNIGPYYSSYYNTYMFGSSKGPGAATMTDETLFTQFPNIIDALTGREATAKLSSTHNYVKACTNISSINGHSVHLPNFQTLCIMYIEAQNIDNMDPTAPSYISRKLTQWAYNDTTYRETLSATLYNYRSTRSLNSNGRFKYKSWDTSTDIYPVCEL